CGNGWLTGGRPPPPAGECIRVVFRVNTKLRRPRVAESTLRRYHLADFSQIPGVACPCGTARRAFTDVEEFPGTVHVTEISVDAKRHYHKRLTETYFFLECGPDAKMELDDEIIPVK